MKVSKNNLVSCIEYILPGKFAEKNEFVDACEHDKKFLFKDKDFLLTKSCEMDKFGKTELLFSIVFVHSAAARWRIIGLRIINDKLKGEQV
jgi:hypothetical protein